MSILVTGGAGYIGSSVAVALSERGTPFVLLDNFSRGTRKTVALAEQLANQKFDLEAVDLNDEEALCEVLRRHRVHCVVHCAALKSAPESVQHPDWYELNNIRGTRTLLECMIEVGIPQLVFASTGGVYGDGTGEPLTESAPTAPMNPYAASKIAGEAMIRATASEIRHVILRFFNVSGAHPSGRLGEPFGVSSNLLPALLARLGDSTPVAAVFGSDWPTRDGTCIRDYIHVDDIVSAIIRSVDHLEGGGGSLMVNLGTGTGSTVLEVIAAVEAASKRTFKVDFQGRRAGDPSAVVAAPKLAHEQLGWKTQWNLKDMANHSYQWFEYSRDHS